MVCAGPSEYGEGVRRVRSYTDSLRRFLGVGVRFTPTFTPSSVFFRELDGRGRSTAPECIWAKMLPQHLSPRYRTPPNRNLPPCHPLRAALGQMLPLGESDPGESEGSARLAVSRPRITRPAWARGPAAATSREELLTWFGRTAIPAALVTGPTWAGGTTAATSRKHLLSKGRTG